MTPDVPARRQCSRCRLAVPRLRSPRHRPSAPAVAEPVREAPTRVVSGPPPQMLHRLDTDERIALTTKSITIGRSADRDVVVDDNRVSRRHAVVAPHGSGWIVTDERSSNGTRLNGSALTANQPATLRAGDSIEIGPVTFRFDIDDRIPRRGDRASGPRVRMRPPVSSTMRPRQRISGEFHFPGTTSPPGLRQRRSRVSLFSGSASAWCSASEANRSSTGCVPTAMVGPDGAEVGPDAATRPKRSRRRIALIASLVVLLLIVGSGVGMYLWANSVFNRIERVQVGSELRQGGGQATNYLLVGTDNRPGVSGNRSDTIMVLHVQGGGSRMLSIPRDLFVKIADTGRQQKINAAYNSGAANLIRTIKNNLGIPIDRYFEVNFVSFGGSGRCRWRGRHRLRQSGVRPKLRSRRETEWPGTPRRRAGTRLCPVTSLRRGRERPATTGRRPAGRQPPAPPADVPRAVLSKAGRTRNPFKLMHIASSMTKGLRIDNKMTLWNTIKLAWDMGGFNPETVKLPVTPETLGNGAQILRLQQPAAESVISQFRT